MAYEKEQLAAVMLEHGIEWEKKGTNEKHLSDLEIEKRDRAKEVTELEQSISDGNEKWQLPEPATLMSAKAYKHKKAFPLVA